jgi:hypothetical protein
MWSSFTITSPESPASVRDRLSAVITTAAPHWLAESITLRGTVSDTGFRVVRNLSPTERGIPPVATGRITPADSGTTVVVNIRPPWWTLLVLGVWSAFWVGLLLRRTVFDSLPDGIHWSEVALFLGMLAFGWGGMFVVGVTEGHDYRKVLSRIVSGTPASRTTTPVVYDGR